MYKSSGCMGPFRELLVWIMAPFLQLGCCRYQLLACVTAGQMPTFIDISQGRGENEESNFHDPAPFPLRP